METFLQIIALPFSPEIRRRSNSAGSPTGASRPKRTFNTPAEPAKSAIDWANLDSSHLPTVVEGNFGFQGADRGERHCGYQ